MLKGKWKLHEGKWRVWINGHDAPIGSEVLVVKFRGKNEVKRITSHIAETRNGSLYDVETILDGKYGKWVTRFGDYCILAPVGLKTNDPVEILLKNGKIKRTVLGNQIGYNLFYERGGKGKCQECNEVGNIGNLCTICGKGYYQTNRLRK